MSTTTVIENYLSAFFGDNGADLDAIRPMLGEHFHFSGPLMKAETPDDFIDQLRNMGPIKLKIEKRDLLIDGDRGVLVFEFLTPDGPVAAAEWYRVSGGKIVEMKLHNDPRAFLSAFER
ncbi:MAG: nuclear transport factor 2 family protein [Sphingomonadaceae bacterium]|nr:nuclear transport factor 2 family protein [Sphingomonadaceae bacterium]